jgi:hypothetical protein
MTRTRRTLSGLAVMTAMAFAFAPSASAAEATCPGTFQVLHNDRIGSMQLPAGPYVITVLDTQTMGCTEASHLFTQFLQDFNGKLPKPWVKSASTRTFRAGSGSTTGFRVALAPPPTPPNPPHPPSRRVCPGYFTVLHNDHIGDFSIPRGRYRITRVGYSGPSCSKASSLFASFLQDWDGVLPRPWFIDPATGSFFKGNTQVGFRIKPYVEDGGSRHGRYPSRGEIPCPTFRVLHNDTIGKLKLPKGPYDVWVHGGLSCPRSTTLFASFLDDPSGDLPSGWRLNSKTASFTRGSMGFRVKLR